MQQRRRWLPALLGGVTGTGVTVALLLLAVAGVTAQFFVTDSLSVFTDQELNAANTFSTGTVSIDDAPDSAFITYAGMLPGDSTIQQLTITNSGSADFRYAMTSASDNVDAKNLRDQITLTIRAKTANPCSSEDGAILFGPAALAGGFFGSPAQGADGGDRSLTAASSENLCFKAELPLATNDTFQSAATTATFTFDAEQTSNNP